MLIKSFKLNLFEFMIWVVATLILTMSFILSSSHFLYLISSIIGISALLYLAKGEPLGQVLTVLFSILYAIVSYQFKYYGEMITYLFMTLPSGLIAFIVWYKNPYQKSQSTVKVSNLSKLKIAFIIILAPIVTVLFYYLLKKLNTPYLWISALSITTSFIASMLTLFRSRYYALFYSLNDLVLIILWVLATINHLSFLPMVLCFIIFFSFDLYGFMNWKKIAKSQM